MISRQDFIKITDYLWEIPKNFRAGMRVPARLYADEDLLVDILKDRSLEQLINLACLPGIARYSLAMPDCHEGYGSPIGGVFATSAEDGIISPGAVGYDENCGVRLLYSDKSEEEIKSRIDDLAGEIQNNVPSGLGRGHRLKSNISDLDRILEFGAVEIVKQGYGKKEDLENCEDGGYLKWADAKEVSKIAKERGRDQVGTLGSGNHFLEIQKVEEIFDEEAAKNFGLFRNQVAIMIHTGSRGLGHQIATDYIRLMLQVMSKYGIHLPDKELACAPFNSVEGQRFFKAMACGANFAWANRQMITHYIRQSWKKIFSSGNLKVLYDVAHNIAKLETYQTQQLIVHRKGATRAFPPGHPEIPEKYQKVGQPVLIPGSMGTASYILVGNPKAEESFYSVCHGAGRTMSRHAALKIKSGKEVVLDLKKKGIIIRCSSLKGIAEEAPYAYKNVDQVVNVVHQAKLSKKVARLVPLAVIKGE